MYVDNSKPCPFCDNGFTLRIPANGIETAERCRICDGRGTYEPVYTDDDDDVRDLYFWQHL